MLALLSACAPDPAPPPSAPADTAVEDFVVDTTTDVIVVGTGPAGVAAALEASEAGARVIVFERDEDPGFGLRLGGLLLGVDTAWQAARGIDDSVALAQSEWPGITGESGTHPGVTSFLSASSATLDWLSARGVPIGGPMMAVGEGTVPRLHQLQWEDDPSPFTVLMAEFSGELRVGVEVTGALVQNGDVVGVRWRELATGTEGATGAAAVVLATGGFLRDLDTVAQLRPDLTERDPLFETNLGSFGSTLPLLDQVGAGSTAPSQIGAYLHSIQDPRQPAGEALIVMVPGSYILVGPDGKRFTDDSNLGDFGPVVEAPEGELWVVIAGAAAAATTLSAPAYNWADDAEVPESLTVEEVVALGSEELFVADTLEELAALTGLGGLVEEVDEFDARAAAGAADPFGRVLTPAAALDAPPWLALRVRPGLAKNFGGAATDSSGHVLDAEGSVIPGLYAAGELVGMILGGGSGTGFAGSVAACYQGGRAAGSTAAAEAAVP